MTKQDVIRQILTDNSVRSTINKTYVCLDGDRNARQTSGEGVLGTLKDFFKKYPTFYDWVVRIVKPTCPSTKYLRSLHNTISHYTSEHVILNIGSGPSILNNRSDIINIDFFAFDNVDIVDDITKMSIKDNSVDCIIAIGVLEHVYDYVRCISEMQRVLKVGGVIFVQVPFIYPFHAAPYDYHRWTLVGLEHDLSCFKIVESGPSSGPTSAVFVCFLEWISTLLSFGIRQVHDILFVILMVTLFPFKFFDKLVEGTSFASNCCNGVYAIAEKVSQQRTNNTKSS